MSRCSIRDPLCGGDLVAQSGDGAGRIWWPNLGYISTITAERWHFLSYGISSCVCSSLPGLTTFSLANGVRTTKHFTAFFSEMLARYRIAMRRAKAKVKEADSVLQYDRSLTDTCTWCLSAHFIADKRLCRIARLILGPDQSKIPAENLKFRHSNGTLSSQLNRFSTL